MNLELYTKQGIDKAFLMMHFINVIEAEPEKMEVNVANYSELVQMELFQHPNL